MKNKLSSISISFVVALLLLAVYFLNSPHGEISAEAPLSEFSASRALKTVKKMSEKPHYVGSENHEVVANYLVKELQNLGLQPFSERFK